VTLLVGAAVVAPAMMALSFAYYSDRGTLLARAKGLQLLGFVVLCLMLTPRLGPLGAAVAIVTTDLVVQFGMLGFAVIGQTLERPLGHLGFLAVLLLIVIIAGWILGLLIGALLPGSGLTRFIVECALWLVCVAPGAAMFASGRLRKRLGRIVPG
jgi:hypothetical protein